MRIIKEGGNFCCRCTFGFDVAGKENVFQVQWSAVGKNQSIDVNSFFVLIDQLIERCFWDDFGNEIRPISRNGIDSVRLNVFEFSSVEIAKLSESFSFAYHDRVHNMVVKRCLNAFTTWIPTVKGKMEKCRCFPYRVGFFSSFRRSKSVQGLLKSPMEERVIVTSS